MTNVSSYSTQHVKTYPAKGAVLTSVKQMRCTKCSKLLALANTTGVLGAEIKCPRCGCMNES